MDEGQLRPSGGSARRPRRAPHFADKPIDDITADDVEDFLDGCLDDADRLDRGLAPLSVKTVRNLYVHLNGIFEFAISKSWCHANPCRAVDKPASPEDDDTEIRFLDQTEPQVGERLGCFAATAIYLYRATPEAVLEDDLARVDRALYLSTATTGLRQGELLGLRWRDVDWPAVSKRFKRALKRAGVREVRFHDLRHTNGTRCAAAGVPLRTLQAWMGHADIKTTMV